MDKKHEIFTQWVQDQGAQLNGVRPAELPGKGIGIMATRDIAEGEKVVFIPSKLLLTTDCVAGDFTKKHGKISLHGLLASFLILRSKQIDRYKHWMATWPLASDFAVSMPIMMPPTRHRPHLINFNGAERSFYLFPPSIRSSDANESSGTTRVENNCDSLLAKQEAKLRRDWKAVSEVFPEVVFEVYCYYWLVINTRSFYYDLPLKLQPQTRDDNLALCPFLDYFNHADSGCGVSYDENGFSVVADRQYSKGEEVVASYGSHSNDFLWTEYGFILESNKWDDLNLDCYMLSPDTGILEAGIRRRLEESSYFGVDGPCWRTQVAIRTQTLGLRDWRKYVNGQPISNEKDGQRNAENFLASKILQPFYEEASCTEYYLEHADIQKLKLPVRLKDIALKRWKQVKRLLRKSVENGLSDPVRSATIASFDKIDTTSDPHNGS